MSAPSPPLRLVRTDGLVIAPERTPGRSDADMAATARTALAHLAWARTALEGFAPSKAMRIWGTGLGTYHELRPPAGRGDIELRTIDADTEIRVVPPHDALVTTLAVTARCDGPRVRDVLRAVDAFEHALRAVLDPAPGDRLRTLVAAIAVQAMGAAGRPSVAIEANAPWEPGFLRTGDEYGSPDGRGVDPGVSGATVSCDDGDLGPVVRIGVFGVLIRDGEVSPVERLRLLAIAASR